MKNKKKLHELNVNEIRALIEEHLNVDNKEPHIVIEKAIVKGVVYDIGIGKELTIKYSIDEEVK